MGSGKWGEIGVEPGICHLSARALGRYSLTLPAGRASSRPAACPAYRRPLKASVPQERALSKLRLRMAADCSKREDHLRKL